MPSNFRSPRFYSALILLLVLTGCQTAGGNVTGVGEASSPAAGDAKSEKSLAAAQIVRFDANEFVGFGPDHVLPILGAPDFVRRDGTAQIWQYRDTNCILDLFLYKSGSEALVKHAELRSRVPGAESLDVCYSRMRQNRKTKPSG